MSGLEYLGNQAADKRFEDSASAVMVRLSTTSVD